MSGHAAYAFDTRNLVAIGIYTRMMPPINARYCYAHMASATARTRCYAKRRVAIAPARCAISAAVIRICCPPLLLSHHVRDANISAAAVLARSRYAYRVWQESRYCTAFRRRTRGVQASPAQAAYKMTMIASCSKDDA